MTTTPAPRRRLLLALAAAPAAAALAARPARAQAAAVVDAFHAALLDVMRNARALGLRGREARIRAAMQAAFNLPAMARIAVGPAWAQLSPAQQQAIAAAFSEWSIATYTGRFDGYGGESFRTEGESTLQNGDRLVRTQLVRPSDAPVQLNYLLRDFGGRWQIVDIYLTGTISELASRRSEFTTILRDGGPERLVAELQRRTQALLRG